MLLISEVQSVLERTYRPIGLRVEECLIGPSRCKALRSKTASSYDPEASTFLRTTSAGDLSIAVYYHPSLIEALEREDPRDQLSHRNIRACIAFIEEVTHAVHAALFFMEGKWRPHSERVLCELEILARIDTYWMLLRFAALLQGGGPSQEVREWIYARVFQDEVYHYQNQRLAKRYGLANQVAGEFVEAMTALPIKFRPQALREFRGLSLPGKLRWRRSSRAALIR